MNTRPSISTVESFLAKIQLERFTALAKVSREITEKLELDDVLSHIVTAVVELTNSDYSRLFLYDEKEGVIRVRASYGRKTSMPPKDTYLPGEGLSGKVFQSGQPVIVNDWSEYKNILAENLANVDWARKEGFSSFIMQPLTISGKVIGVFNCASRAPGFFNEGDLGFLDAIASQASISIHNAGLYEEAVRSRQFFQNVLEGNADAIMAVEKATGVIIHWNRAAEKLYGYTREEAIGKDIGIIIPKTSESLLHRMEVTNSSEPVYIETKRQNKDGIIFPVGVTLSPVKDGKGHIEAVVGIHRDLSEHKEKEKRLREESRKFEELSRVDSLTGMGNRRVLGERLPAEISRVKRYDSSLSILILDIDHFKKINDTYGHFVGDEVLIRIGKVIRGVTRDLDIPVRMGGEEFCLLLPETDLEGAKKIAVRLKAMVSRQEFSTSQNGTIQVTCSIGTTEFLKDSDTERTFLERADYLLYQAKENGRNQIRSESFHRTNAPSSYFFESFQSQESSNGNNHYPETQIGSL